MKLDWLNFFPEPIKFRVTFWVRHYEKILKWSSHWISNPQVAGSNPGYGQVSELNVTGRLPSYKPVRKIWSQTWLPGTRVWLPETRVYVPRPSIARELCRGCSMLFLAEFLIAWKDWAGLQQLGFKFPALGSLPVILSSLGQVKFSGIVRDTWRSKISTWLAEFILDDELFPSVTENSSNCLSSDVYF